MHIKRIVIQGFKTYKNTTVIESFSPHNNVVVGRNGSGKSNFFAAIRFVLSDAYTNMSREERQSLIHEGSGTVMSAFVEIIFDNTDRRLPIDTDEVIIRRTIGMKKDDYSLDQKSATKSDIMNLLESAGFSRSNPYYIVPQGRITSLTNAKDAERLQLLKEVAGAKVFETKLKESLKEMNNTNKKRDQIDEMLSYIESRLQDLDMEKNDFKDYEKLTTKKKALEFNLFDRELSNLNENIENIENEYASTIANSNALVENLSEREKLANNIENELSELNSSLKLLQIDKRENENEIEEILSKIGELKGKISELTIGLNSNNDSSDENNSSLILVEKKINKNEKLLKKLLPKINTLKEKESELNKKLSEYKSRHRALLSKRGRFSQFENKKERDTWLKEESENLNDLINSKESESKTLLTEITNYSEKLSDLVAKIEKLSIDESLSPEVEKLETEVFDLKLAYNKLIDERKSFWREESKLNSIISSYEQEKSRASQFVNETMSLSTSLGLESVSRIAEKLGLDGVYGPLGELIDVSEKYKIAVDVIGGETLFNVVVDTDKTASIIMDELNREKSGRVTFIPLNRLKQRTFRYPAGNDSVPLIKKIAFDDSIAPAVQHVFGNSIVAISLERGAEITKEYKLNAITLDGDKCDSKGVITGGFRDNQKSRVNSLKELRKWKLQISECNEKLKQIQKSVDEKNIEINKISEELSQKRKELSLKTSKAEETLQERSQLISQRDRIESEIANIKERIESIETSKKSLTVQLKEYSHELSSPFSEKMKKSEETEIKELGTQIPDIEAELNSTLESLNELVSEASAARSELEENLLPRKEHIEEKINLAISSNPTENLQIKMLSQNLTDLEAQKSEIEQANEELHDRVVKINKEIDQKNENLNKLNENQRAIIKKLESYSIVSEKGLSKKILLTNRRDIINKKIRDLGILPDEAFTTYNDSNILSNVMLKELNEVTESLKKYSHVNKRAIEQFVNFTKQRDALVERRVELDSAKSSIEDLIKVLEKRKDDAIMRTFKEVSIGFQQIFETLAPSGSGKLIIQRRKEDSNTATRKNPNSDFDGDSDSENESEKSKIESYTGISISVSFNSKNDEQQRIEQLSGGQKSLCALALILAIQKCDPAPFYLFDEIDANLDTQYRTAVAKLIKNLSRNNAQFICTTFRPEMLQVADKFYGVMFNNKVSTVSDIGKADALSFIENQQSTSTNT
ncbi:unnamed protein product [[Candida] boidinii]|uniref:Structural maintenance of chromosomes protein n=1 Tax=Candida boidinii TaxID=5477 RepID=A0A9W6W7H5_CANBO|nr:hypothetical protein B5S30_g3405 [[Candida] boidinii]OWB86114.1 hypothetical protein B5S33_g4796 [[Candida] boidinii]GME67086.1 unnamed protein product [[Candida] boidinii]GMF97916.1 unnamed protein product [[Candida] boidinii]